jgi:hypothetical protein
VSQRSGIEVKNNATLIAALVTLLLPTLSSSTPIAILTLDSEPRDPIGQGQSVDITYAPGDPGFFSTQVRRTLPNSDDPAELLFVLGNVTSGFDNTFALLFFGTDRLGIPMGIGDYSNAERADFASPGHAGLDISFQNRGCNEDFGSFSVEQFALSDAALQATGFGVERFAATFEQHCDQPTAPALFGTFYYDAFGRLPTGAPEPGTLALFGFGLVGMQAARRIRTRKPSR